MMDVVTRLQGGVFSMNDVQFSMCSILLILIFSFFERGEKTKRN
jgi:hypothetical protein